MCFSCLFYFIFSHELTLYLSLSLSLPLSLPSLSPLSPSLSTHVQGAAWNGEGDVLLVSKESSPIINLVNFQASSATLQTKVILDGRCNGKSLSLYLSISLSLSLSHSPSRLYHLILTSLPLPFSDEHTPAGGSVDQIAWSPTGERCAITYSGSEPGTELVGLFGCSPGLLPVFHPIGFIRGPASLKEGVHNKPTLIEFCPHFDSGALLTVVWEQGQITNYPLYFSSSASSL